MRNRRIIIWAEGGRQTGMGHLSRCSVIAEKMRSINFPVSFLVNNDPSAVQWISDRGFEWRVVDMNADTNARETKDAIVLIDSKKPVERLVASLKQNGCMVVLIDNVTAARLQADVVIYPTAMLVNGLPRDGFSGRLYHGAEYIPLSESYIEARKHLPGAETVPPYQVLVTMGGSDPNGLTMRVVSALEGFREDVRLTVVIGPAFPRDAQIESAERRGLAATRFLRNVHNLAPLLAESHIVVTAVGTTIYEAAFIGVPSVVIGNYASDEEDVARIESLGIGVGLGYFEDVDDARLRDAVISLVVDAARHRRMSNQGRSLIDGRGASRIVAIIQQLMAKGN